MNQQKFNSLINSLFDSLKDYKLDDSFDYYDAIHEICSNSDYSFVYYKASQLVNFVQFEYDSYYDDLFDEAEREIQENGYGFHAPTLNDYMLQYSFHILKVAMLKKYAVTNNQ